MIPRRRDHYDHTAVVGDTLLLVIDADGQVTETELDLPGPDAAVTVNNGVLTVQVDQ